VNGDLSYEGEYVPNESRLIDPAFDNRWIYVDSLSNDTTFVGAIMFGGNAPKGYHLLRLKVDLSNEAILDPAGVHVAGSFQGFNPSTSILCKLNDTIDELIVYLDTLITSAQFRYVNGKTVSGYETVPGACNVFGNRETMTPKDTVLDVVCFSACMACLPAGIHETQQKESYSLYPNPAAGKSVLEFESDAKRRIEIFSMLGSSVRNYGTVSGTRLEIEKEELKSGVYFIYVQNGGMTTTAKLVIR